MLLNPHASCNPAITGGLNEAWGSIKKGQTAPPTKNPKNQGRASGSTFSQIQSTTDVKLGGTGADIEIGGKYVQGVIIWGK